MQPKFATLKVRKVGLSNHVLNVSRPISEMRQLHHLRQPRKQKQVLIHTLLRLLRAQKLYLQRIEWEEASASIRKANMLP
jgi:hypothetical protein